VLCLERSAGSRGVLETLTAPHRGRRRGMRGHCECTRLLVISSDGNVEAVSVKHRDDGSRPCAMSTSQISSPMSLGSFRPAQSAKLSRSLDFCPFERDGQRQAAQRRTPQTCDDAARDRQFLSDAGLEPGPFIRGYA